MLLDWEHGAEVRFLAGVNRYKNAGDAGDPLVFQGIPWHIAQCDKSVERVIVRTP